MADLVWVTQEEFNQRGLDLVLLLAESKAKRIYELNDKQSQLQ